MTLGRPGRPWKLVLVGGVAVLSASGVVLTGGADDRPPATAAVTTPATTSVVPAARASAAPAFEAVIGRVTPEVRSRMGTSWRPGCPVAPADLRVIAMPFWDFEGVVQAGELMVHARWAEQIAGVFRALYEARFPIERMELANGYMGNDPPLAQRNNTAGFNCRSSVGGGRWSEHSYGSAVDINPDQNPYVSRSGHVEPPFGAPYMDRSIVADGMLRADSLAVRAFRAIGWRWGGSWRSSKDYMHFSASGR